MISVLANPEKYYGRRIVVVGYAHFEFEGNALFLYREDFELRRMTNSIWLDRTGHDASLFDAADDHYALVIGKYIHRDGHMGCCVGTITEIETVERWPLGSEDATPLAPDTSQEAPSSAEPPIRDAGSRTSVFAAAERASEASREDRR